MDGRREANPPAVASAKGVLRRALSTPQRRDVGQSSAAEEEAIVGLDEIGDDDLDDGRNLELQQLGLSKRRAKTFVQQLDAAMAPARVEEIVYVDPSRRPRTLRAQELEAWFAKLNPKALAADFRLARAAEAPESPPRDLHISGSDLDTTSSSCVPSGSLRSFISVLVSFKFLKLQ